MSKLPSELEQCGLDLLASVIKSLDGPPKASGVAEAFVKVYKVINKLGEEKDLLSKELSTAILRIQKLEEARQKENKALIEVMTKLNNQLSSHHFKILYLEAQLKGNEGDGEPNPKRKCVRS